MPLLGEHYRCSICNAVNNAEIATYPEEYRQTKFVEDPSSPFHVICLECRSSLDDVDGEWLDEEEDWDPDEDDFYPE